MKNTTPIIIGGCHRSGTSLVRRLLNSHSNIFCGPEVKFLRDFYGEYPTDPLQHVRYSTSARSLISERELLQILGSSYIEVLKRATTNAGKIRWAEKCPENIIHLSDWQYLLGNKWVFIHVIRNPIDVLASMHEVNFPIALPTSLNERIDFWINYNKSGIDFYNTHSIRYLILRYENLVKHPVLTLKSLMSWLGESFQKQQLDFNSQVHKSGLEDPKILQTSHIHTNSLNRWKNIFTPSDIKYIETATHDMWEKLLEVENSLQ